MNIGNGMTVSRNKNKFDHIVEIRLKNGITIKYINGKRVNYETRNII